MCSASTRVCQTEQHSCQLGQVCNQCCLQSSCFLRFHGTSRWHSLPSGTHFKLERMQVFPFHSRCSPGPIVGSWEVVDIIPGVTTNLGFEQWKLLGLPCVPLAGAMSKPRQCRRTFFHCIVWQILQRILTLGTH